MKKNIKKLLLVSCLSLLPMLIGIYYYNKLPDMIPTRYDISGNIIDYTSKMIFVYLAPIMFFVVNIFVALITKLDPRNKNANDKIYGITIFIVPIISNIFSYITYYNLLFGKINVSLIINIVIAFMFIILGNYLPKTSRNYTIGIKTPWTMDNDIVWEKTHRLAGKLFILLGIIVLLTSISTYGTIITFIFTTLLVLIIFIYSYLTHKNLGK